MTDEIPTSHSKAFSMMTDFIPWGEVKLGKFFAVLNDEVQGHQKQVRAGLINRENIFCTLSWFVAVLRMVDKEQLVPFTESIKQLDKLVAEVFGDMKWEDHFTHITDLKNALNRFSWHMHVDIPYARLHEKLSAEIILQGLWPKAVIAQ